ncbi:hypothetical protein GND98_019300 [Clostridium butyricum]|uniref:DUF5050 domain-containing protein n=1 Tax=Clostridium butyricum TaxID=1492 RepID=A0A6L9ET73_CLOBU|nr:hypothetical protein [Clostridium butyricum]
MINKIGDDYFINDCWHHRIIYNGNLLDSIEKWNTLTEDIIGGHSIASDGGVYICDDTDGSKIRVFKKENSIFKETQIFDNIKGRPHFVKYDENTKAFYIISSMEGKIYILKNNNGKVEITNIKTISEINNTYTRSFNIIDGYMYFVSGGGYIRKVNYIDGSFEIVESYKVPDNMVGMNFIEKIDDYFYLSSYTNSNGEIAPMFIRIKNINELTNKNYEDLYNLFGFDGAPYYISKFDNKFFVTEVDVSSSIKCFEVNNNEISNIETYYYTKGHTEESQKRKQSRY